MEHYQLKLMKPFMGMNRIKGASCSGEGGEDAKRFKLYLMEIVQTQE